MQAALPDENHTEDFSYLSTRRKLRFSCGENVTKQRTFKDLLRKYEIITAFRLSRTRNYVQHTRRKSGFSCGKNLRKKSYFQRTFKDF